MQRNDQDSYAFNSQTKRHEKPYNKSKLEEKLRNSSSTKSFGVVLFGFAIVLLDVFRDDETGVGELPNVGDVVVLCQVNAESCTNHEREAALDYPHPISDLRSLSLQLLFLRKFSGQQKQRRIAGFIWNMFVRRRFYGFFLIGLISNYNLTK